ncbi:hypothetical protein WN48_09532 [Eufriesea mexicana]|nr:hypothetical protein WN48_09532 [Eufriesea mexicana]
MDGNGNEEECEPMRRARDRLVIGNEELASAFDELIDRQRGPDGTAIHQHSKRNPPLSYRSILVRAKVYLANHQPSSRLPHYREKSSTILVTTIHQHSPEGDTFPIPGVPQSKQRSSHLANYQVSPGLSHYHRNPPRL